jgi:hypothetical protein
LLKNKIKFCLGNGNYSAIYLQKNTFWHLARNCIWQ